MKRSKIVNAFIFILLASITIQPIRAMDNDSNGWPKLLPIICACVVLFGVKICLWPVLKKHISCCNDSLVVYGGVTISNGSSLQIGGFGYNSISGIFFEKDDTGLVEKITVSKYFETIDRTDVSLANKCVLNIGGKVNFNLNLKKDTKIDKITINLSGLSSVNIYGKNL